MKPAEHLEAEAGRPRPHTYHPLDAPGAPEPDPSVWTELRKVAVEHDPRLPAAGRLVSAVVTDVRPHGARYRGWPVSVVGLRYSDLESIPTAHLPCRLLRLPLEEGSSALVQVWHLRAGPPASALYLEAVWRPGWADARIIMAGLEHVQRAGDIDRLRRDGLRLIHRMAPAGKPEGAGVESPEAFLANLRRGLERLHRDRSRITAEATARQVGVDRTTLYARLKKLGLNWPTVKAWRPNIPFPFPVTQPID